MRSELDILLLLFAFLFLATQATKFVVRHAGEYIRERMSIVTENM